MRRAPLASSRLSPGRRAARAASPGSHRPRENMAGVSMVLAEYIKFKQGLNLMYSARTMLTPTMFSRRRSQHGHAGR